MKRQVDQQGIMINKQHSLNHIKQKKKIKKYQVSQLSVLSRRNYSNTNHILIKYIPQRQRTQFNNSLDILRVNKSYRIEMTPIKNSQNSESGQQNLRINKLMQLVAPRTDRYRKQSQEINEKLKQRISKNHREGSKIKYQYKKSLIQVKKRKKQRDDYQNNRSNIIREEAQAQLQLIIQKSIDIKKQQGKNTTYTFDNQGHHPQIIKSNQQTCKKSHINNSIVFPTQLSARQVTNYDEVHDKSDQSKQYFLARHREHISKQIQTYNLSLLQKQNKKSLLDRQSEIGNI